MLIHGNKIATLTRHLQASQTFFGLQWSLLYISHEFTLRARQLTIVWNIGLAFSRRKHMKIKLDCVEMWQI